MERIFHHFIFIQKKAVKLTYWKQEQLHLNDKGVCPKRQRLKDHDREGSDVSGVPLTCQEDIISHW